MSPQNWTHIFKSRKSEKPCIEHSVKKIRKNRPKACSKHVWTILETIKGIFWILKFFWFFWKFSKARPSMEHWAKKLFQKNHPRHVQNTFEYFCERFWAFLDFWIFSKTRTSMEHWGIFFRKKMPQKTFEHLRTILDNFRTLKFFCFFSWVFSKYLPQILSPENWIQFF